MISLIGAIAILPENIDGLSGGFIKIVDILILLSAGIFVFRHYYSSYWNKMLDTFSFLATKNTTFFVIFLIIIFWQVYCVYLLSGTSTWDWMFLVQRATTSKLGWPWPNYLSINPNNTMLLKLESMYWHLLNHPTFEHFMYALNLLNVVIIDFGTYLVWRLGKKFTHQTTAKITLILLLALFTCVPFFVIPYSDTLSFFLTALLLNTFVKIFKIHSLKNLILYGLLVGIELVFAYMIKPSLLVLPIAALLVIFVLWVSKNDQIDLKYLSLTLIWSLTILCGGSILMKNYLYNHNGIVKVDTRQALPMSHFAAMGITGDGDYNVTDMFNSVNIKNPSARNQASLRLIKQRFISQGGIIGYEKFLFHKQIKNSADGTMGWGHEVYYLKAFHSSDKIRADTFPRKYFLDNNGIATEQKFDFRTVQQFIWIATLVLILFSVLDQSLWGLYLKLSAIGFFMFLLLFEGGRSRYLIQFLPVLLLLSGLGIQNIKNYFYLKNDDGMKF
ncbi:glycosyltransferase family protein [Fructobacillus ficulneus]|uniref:Putative membrane protein n=1 Tax=Fructobacillus ficulneus TaxID=157463 RepID=A0A0K8MF53_9LACO|nr:hypothetical protein [Fructobacillus ficulneus]GAO99112.1 putative membrane protein [Fructobacillus ficulneus]